jgi:hypothetical protein
MSIKLMHEVYGKELDHAKQAVLLAMADHADDEGWHCFPSMDRIAYKTGYSARNVIRVVSELRKMGALIVVAEATPRRPTEYRIRLQALPDKPPFEAWRAEHGRRGDKLSSLGATDCHPRGDKSDTLGVTRVSPQPSLEPSDNKPPYSPPLEKDPGAASASALRRRAGYGWLFDR